VNDDIAHEHIQPSIALGLDGKIHVVWADYRNDVDGRWVSGGGIDGVNDQDIYYSNSTDGGFTFNKNVKVNDDVGSSWQGTSVSSRVIAVDSNDKIHVVWGDDRGGLQAIYYANSTDGGIKFNNNVRVSDSGIIAYNPAIAVDENGDVYIVWQDARNPTFEIYFAKSTDGGNSFSANKNVSDITGLSDMQPSIAVNNNLLGITWQTATAQPTIYFADSNDKGDTFRAPKGVDDDLTNSGKGETSIAINLTGYICIAWWDARNGDRDIFFANSTDGGAIFSQNQKVNDNIVGMNQVLPSLALRNGTSYIVWTDERSGNVDIYFSRSNFPPSMVMPIYPSDNSILSINQPVLEVTSAIDKDNDGVYYNFTISNQPDAESGTNYSSGWIDSISWITPVLPDGKWYWHTYTSDMWNITAPNWIWNFTVDTVPPTISNLQPPDASTTNNNTSVISVNYSDPSGINVSSVLFEVDGVDQTSNATKTPSGLNYAPIIPMADGIHLIHLEVEDSVGNLATTTWSFTVDSTSPTITNLRPLHSSTISDNKRFIWY
jgi:hypothetical protein